MPEKVKNLHGHESTKSRRSGNEDNCILCGLPIIFDGHNWRTIYEVGTTKVRKLRTMYAVDKMTGRYD